MLAQAPGKMQALVDETGLQPDEIVTDAIEHSGSIQGAAMHLGMSPGAIRYWLRECNLEVIQFVKVRRKATS